MKETNIKVNLTLMQLINNLDGRMSIRTDGTNFIFNIEVPLAPLSEEKSVDEFWKQALRFKGK